MNDINLKKTLGKARQIQVQAERERLPPGKKRTVGKKRFGIMSTYKESYCFTWGPSYQWYATAKQRDDAMVSLRHNSPWAVLSRVER